MENIGKVSNEDFERALNNDDNKRIMNSVVKSFRLLLDNDEIYRCKLMALWESMLQWTPGKRKFSSMLYQKLNWACLGVLHEKNKRQKRHISLDFDPPDKPVTYKTELSEVLDLLSPYLREIMIKRLVYRMTLREIGTIYGCCAETVRKRILLATKILQDNQKNHKI